MNALCGIDHYSGTGTYTTEGIMTICDMLKVNSSLTSLSYVPPSLNSSPKRQQPSNDRLVLSWQPQEKWHWFQFQGRRGAR